MERRRIAMRVCSSCHNPKPAASYHVRKNWKGRIAQVLQCPECIGKRVRKWHDIHRQRVREYHRARRARLRYGIEPETYARMFAEQGGVCAICGKHETKTVFGVPHRLSVDHDHVTNLVRGLLCGNCNAMVGMAGDSPEVLNAGAAYLRQHQPVRYHMRSV